MGTCRYLRDSVLEISTADLIGGLLLIEMHQRPGFIRAAEWIVSIVVPARIRRPITRGPLQMANGPWNFEKAVATTADALDGVLAESAGTTRDALTELPRTGTVPRVNNRGRFLVMPRC
jgi:hypothetical protein